MKKLIMICVLLVASSARGDVDLGLRIAKVAANEGALVNWRETALIWQTARHMGRGNPEKIAEWLAKHSRRVHGLRPCSSGNCLWSRNLTRSDVYPAGLTIKAELWAIRVAPVWLSVLQYADWLVRGLKTQDDPCHIQPRTWGGPMDRAGALARGLFPIGCVGRCHYNSCNDGYTTYDRCWRDGVWSCDPAEEPAIQSVEPIPETKMSQL